MLKMHGENCKRRSNVHKRTVLFAVTIIAVLLLVIAYYAVAEPIVSRFLITTTDIHQGLEYFKDHVYTTFEGGSYFYNLLCQINYNSLGEIVDFYHVDNQLRDNPIYGKMCDIFAIDIKSSTQDFTEIKKRLCDDDNFCCSIEDYNLFVLQYAAERDGDVALIAVSDEFCLIRIIFFTDKDPVADNSRYGTTLIQQSSLVWDGAQQGKTD